MSNELHEPQYLGDYEHIVKRVCPEAVLRPGPRGGVEVSWHVRVSHAYDRAATVEHAEELVATLAERVRGRAIRDLGLRPILDAQEAEVRGGQVMIRDLQALALRRASRIAHLEEELAILRYGSA